MSKIKLEKLEWFTVKRKINDLIPFEKNPRTMSEKQIEDLTLSLQKFNLVEVPAIDLDGTIVAGHQRVKILQLVGRGEEEIDVRIPSRKLTKEEYEQYLLTSNALKGDWDYDLLKNFDVDMLLDAGFSENELASIWDDSLETEDDGFDTAKELASIPSTDIQPGDLFAMGPHRLYCIDSTDWTAVEELVGINRVDMINTDIPFNINLDYNMGIGGKKRYGGTIHDNKTDEEYYQFVKRLINSGLKVAKPDCHIFFWCDEKYVGMLQGLYREMGIDQKRLCLWIKDNQNPTPKIAFNKVAECCLYGIKGHPYLSDKVKNFNEVQNKEVGSGNRLIDDIIDLFNIWLVKRLPGSEYTHPTEKPPTLYEKALRRCSKPGDIVLDICAGSGSIMAACEQMKRVAYLAEIEPIFCQLILNRYEKLTGNKPTKLN